MIERLQNIINNLRGSLWVLPALMSAGAVALAYVILFSGVNVARLVDAEAWWLFSGDARTARDLLSSLLAGMITMTSLVVSITMVVLSLAAGQLGPRIIWSFIRDRQIQGVLGLFLATIFYLLIVLRSISDELGADYVPHLAVTIGSVLTAICLFALLFHIHKVARSIIADEVVKRVANDLESAIGHLPEDGGKPPPPDADEQDPALPHSRPLAFEKAGYIQVIDYQALVEVAEKCGLVVQVHVRAGHFLHRNGRHATVFSEHAITDEHDEAIRAAIVIGHGRSPTQDLEYSIRQLVEIAVRALSPGINDPFTAIAVIHHLGSALEKVSGRTLRPAVYRDEAGRIRVLADAGDFAGLLDAALNQIRQSGKDVPAVLIELTRMCARLASVWSEEGQRRSLAQHVEKLRRTARRHIEDPDDLADFEHAAERAAAVIPDVQHPDAREQMNRLTARL